MVLYLKFTHRSDVVCFLVHAFLSYSFGFMPDWELVNAICLLNLKIKEQQSNDRLG